MFLDTWFSMQGELKSYPHIELNSHQHWNPHKIEFPLTKYSVQEESEGRNVSKVKICFSGDTPGDTYRPLDGDIICDFISHSKVVVVHAGMDKFHRRLAAGVAVTATCSSVILTVNRDKKRETSLAVSSKERKYRSDRMASRIVADIISKEKTTQQVSLADELVDTIQDVSMPQTFLSKNRHSSTTSEDLSKRLGISISKAALTLKATTHKLTRSAIIPFAQR